MSANGRSVAWRVARFEWRLVRAERLLVPLAFCFALALVYAAGTGAGWSHFQRDAAAQALGEEQQRLGALAARLDSLVVDTSPLRPFGDARNPYAAMQSNARRYTVLPAAPLAPLAIGQSDLFPSYYRVSLTSRETFLANDEVENPTNLLTGRFDLAFLIVYVFPLVVIALTYNLLSSERERGTLSLIAAQPVRMSDVILGKVLTRGGLVVGLAILTVFAGAVLAGVNFGAAGALGSLAGWVVVCVAYAAFWMAAALVVNLISRSSAANALALLGVWLVLVVLVPATLAATANALHPLPSRVEHVTAVREASNTAAARGSELLAIYYQDHPELMAAQGRSPNMNDFATRSIAVAEEVVRATRPLSVRFDTALSAQQRIVDLWRFASPAVATHDALTRLAQTDSDRYREFQRQSDDYVTEIKRYALPLIAARQRFTRAALEAMPTFHFDASSAAKASSAAMPAASSFATVALFAFVLFLIGFERVRSLSIADA